MEASDQAHQAIVQLTQVLVVEGVRAMRAFAGKHGLHATDVEALTWVRVSEQRGSPLTAGGLADRLGMTTGAITAIVDRLERAGHIQRSRDESDRRKVLLRYAPQGEDLAGRFFAPQLEIASLVMAGFSEMELKTVLRYLTQATAATLGPDGAPRLQHPEGATLPPSQPLRGCDCTPSTRHPTS